jgi:DNA-binding NarL/FixJ family response regulator
VRVIVADDSGLYRDLLVHMLTGGGHEVVATARTADELMAVVEATAADIVLTDIRMPPTHTDDGLRAVLRIRERHPHLGVVLLSHHGEVEYAMQLVEAVPAGAGYLLKERATGAAELLDTIERVTAGGLVIDPEIVTRLMRRPRDDNPLRQLTERESQTLALMAEGLANTAIAARLKVTVSTVEKHATALFRKLCLSTDPGDPSGKDNARVRAVLVYLRFTGQL